MTGGPWSEPPPGTAGQDGGQTEWTLADDAVAPLVSDLSALLEDERRGIQHLAEYFMPGGGYWGGSFERFGQGSHGTDEIGCHDLLSLSLLDAPLPGGAVRDLVMDSRLRDEVSERLRQIDDINLWEASEASLDSAARLWGLLEGRTEGMGDTRLSKLLHRKRPHLIPISDSVVRKVLPLPEGVPDRWRGYLAAFRKDPSLVGRLEGFRRIVASAGHVSPLRVLDVITWMQGRGDRSL